jgi:cytidylate kinase
MTLVAISAAYGAGGSRVGPELAGRLDVPFIDRGIPIAVAQRLDVTVDEAIAQEDEGGAGRSLLERLLAGFAAADTEAPTPEMLTGEDFHSASEAVVCELAASGRGVILGRAAVAALREDPRVLRIRLTGPVEARIRLGMALGQVDEATARASQRRLDAAHAEYVRRFYGLDIDDPSLYHVIIDVPAIGIGAALQILETTARALGSARVSGR